ncbi:WXG100 family type VII secretion target [Yimella sp. cx-573]|nr:WXG100 family type VII secretion target [Yimella sp. cx-573]
MANKGMDTDIARGVHSQLTGLHGQLTNLISSIGSQVTTVHGAWDGADSIQFESEWSSVHRPALTNAASALEQFARTLMNNITTQETTSGTLN